MPNALNLSPQSTDTPQNTNSSKHLSARLTIYAETTLPTIHGDFRLRVYKHAGREHQHESGQEPLAMVSGYLDKTQSVAVRIHSACFTSEVLGSCKCECKEQLDASLAYIQAHTGVVIYLNQEGRGIGLADKIRVYALQEHGFDTIEANEALGLAVDNRQYHDAASILADLGIKDINLLTNNPDKIAALESMGFNVRERTPITAPANPHSASYLATKKDKMGHLI